MELLDKVNVPKDIKSFSYIQLEQLCAEIREYMIDCCAKNPGHLGASLGTVELAVALHYIYDTPNDKLVWDVGHQAYAHKILTGRKEAFVNNRKYKGISGFPKMAESEYDSFGGGHTSVSISAALGIAEAAKIKGESIKTIAVIGDGALSGGLAYEGLNNAGALKSDILVILNDNQISIDHNVGAMHNYLVRISTSYTYNKVKSKVWDCVGGYKIGRFIQKFMRSAKQALFKNGSIFQALGFRYFGSIDGNNLNELVTTLSKIKEIKGPKLLHIRTVKGKGYKPAEENQSVWHAPGKFNVETGERILKNPNIYRYQDIFGETIVELAKENEKIVAVTPAMASGCSMTKMMEVFPHRSFDVGIAEQHAVTFSAGMAANGMLPFCNIYSTFMQRAYDNIIHDVAIQKLKVIFCIDRGGIVGEDGATHQGAFDLSYFRLVPNITVAAPLNEIELRNMLYSATLQQWDGAVAIRYPRGNCEGLDWQKPFEYIPVGKAQILVEGEGVAVVSLGTIGNRVSKAIEKAKEAGCNPMHVNMRFLKPLDSDALENVCKKCSTIITVEDGTLLGGLNSAVSEWVAANNYSVKVVPLGIPDKFVDQGTVDELISECGYNVQEIFDNIVKEYRRK